MMVKAHGCCRLFVPALLRVFDYFCGLKVANEATGFSDENRSLLFRVRATVLIVKDNRLFVIEDEDGCYTIGVSAIPSQ